MMSEEIAVIICIGLFIILIGILTIAVEVFNYRSGGGPFDGFQ